MSAGLILTSTVPREYVHRAAVAEVMLTDWTRRDQASFTVCGQWPRSHSFFTPSADGFHDPMIAAETIRQAGLLLCHAELGVPLDHRFLMHELLFQIRPGRMSVGDTPAALEITIWCTEIKRRAGAVHKLRYEAALSRQGRLAATGTVSTSIVSDQVYRRMRRGTGGFRGRSAAPMNPATPAAPVDPAKVGRRSAADVVLSPADGPDRWWLRLDTAHPVLFDHPADHTPGMALAEAARQASFAAIGCAAAPVTAMANSFSRFVELDRPCLIQAVPAPDDGDGGHRRVLVTGRQDGVETFTSTVTVAPPSAG